ncbi:trypsin-like serine peptidase [Thalassovita taeanensis]|uniref:V8-like Glu-specific endopeptidase n=1 Tax=Thalassovita taeanensis TaxID=657014 RepID=A0A1H9IHF6_9RHOB|nr:trypsin-like serine protease [Thalassovita taeanensis]SEQ74009.1 V8-like Glu-specific endopeptidase [Thalassovita taeanensis]
MLHRVFLLIFSLLLAGGTADAQDSALRRMNTGDDSRGWEAVGRLDLGGRGFCTGAMITPDLVLTAAHCLFDKTTGQRIDHSKVEFLAGWRNGRAEAYRMVRRAVVHPSYQYDGAVTTERVRNDIALLELQRPIRNTSVHPFATARNVRAGDSVGVVSYARGRADAPSMQEMCGVIGRQKGVLVMSCDVDFGSSGAPVFSFDSGEVRIVSVVSAKAEAKGRQVALGSQLDGSVALLRSQLDAGVGVFQAPPPGVNRIGVAGARRNTGAKFIRPGGG